MLRALVLLLLLANAAALAWQQGWLGGWLASPQAQDEREPERMARQIQPETLKLVAPQAASAAMAAAAAAAEAAAVAAADRCLQAGPFAAADAGSAEKLLRDAGLASGTSNGQFEALRSERGGVFLIYMGRYPDREALQRKQEELRRMKVEFEELRNAPEFQPGLSLGRFNDRAGADAALADLTQRNVRTAKVLTLTAPTTLQVLRVSRADEALASKLAALKLPGGLAFSACPAP